jgi:hypothetical protein
MPEEQKPEGEKATGFMICKKATSSPFACAVCRQRIEVSVFGKIRMREMHEKEGVKMTLLCNECGGKVMDEMRRRSEAEPEKHREDSIEILPNALEAIADTDKKLALELFRKDAETRARDAKDKKP